jgi:hypothetical protein
MVEPSEALALDAHVALLEIAQHEIVSAAFISGLKRAASSPRIAASSLREMSRWKKAAKRAL